MLDHRGELALSPAQVAGLERLCLDAMREAIRREADLSLALLDVAALLRPDPTDPARPADMPRIEAAVHEVERVGADLDLARIRAIEAGKAQLTAEQRQKLAALMAGDDPPAAVAVAAPSAPGHPGSRPGPHDGPRPPLRPYGYAVPPAIVERAPSYIEPPSPPSYWYYCPSAGAYYPYVQTCDEAWVLVPSWVP